MSDKLVHVKSYTRDDGTKVKEHYRGADSNIENDGAEQAPLLFGGVSEDVYYPEEKGFLEKYSDAIEVAVFVAQMAGTIAQEGLRIASELRTADEASSSELGSKLEEVVGNMRQAHSLSVSTEQATLEKLSNTTNQREYKELYDTYVHQRELNRASEAVINRISYSAEHKNYEDVEKGLKEYKTLQTQSVQSVTDRANLNAQPTSLQFEDQAVPEYVEPSRSWDDVLRNVWHDEPQKQKIAIDVGMELNNLGKYTPDAKELYNISSKGFEQNMKYVNDNGILFDSISKLPFSFKAVVKEKVQKQLGLEDSKGIVFSSDSALSQDIKRSVEFKTFVVQNFEDLQDGKVLTGSLEFKSSSNLYYALKRAAILDTYINSNGDIVSFIFDTYDFNANDPDWRVEWARNVQQNGLLSNFYTINTIVIPKQEWMSWVLIYY